MILTDHCIPTGVTGVQACHNVSVSPWCMAFGSVLRGKMIIIENFLAELLSLTGGLTYYIPRFEPDAHE